MEIFEGVFGRKRKEQEREQIEALEGIKIQDTPYKQLIGPDGKKKEVLVANVSNDEFLKVIKEKQIKEYLERNQPTSDTSNYHRLFIDMGHKVMIETEVGEVFYDPNPNFLDTLHDMNFRVDQDTIEDGGHEGVWKTVRLEEKETISIKSIA